MFTPIFDFINFMRNSFYAQSNSLIKLPTFILILNQPLAQPGIFKRGGGFQNLEIFGSQGDPCCSKKCVFLGARSPLKKILVVLGAEGAFRKILAFFSCSERRFPAFANVSLFWPPQKGGGSAPPDCAPVKHLFFSVFFSCDFFRIF